MNVIKVTLDKHSKGIFRVNASRGEARQQLLVRLPVSCG